MNKVIETKNLWFSYNKEITLENINLSVFENELLGIIGPNGAGKTTLLKLMLGLIKPSSGTISILGREPKNAGEYFGYVPQYSVYDISFPITVIEVVMMGFLSRKSVLKKFNRSDKQAAIEILEKVGMSEYAYRQIGTLSGGQKQRVLLARALVSNPKLVIMDEPFTGVDICFGFGFYEFVKELKKTKTVILVSHDIGVVSSYVDRIACLNRVMTCHDSKEEALKNLDKVYGCPVDVIAHGIPHRVLGEH